VPAGVTVLDVSDVQSRKLFPQVRQVGKVSRGFPAGISQHAIPITVGSKPYLVMVDEFGSEGVRFIDISDERNPRVVRQLQLGIQQPENADMRRTDTTGDGFFGYEAHYCSVDRSTDPTALACGYFQSGVRVFDIQDLLNPREIAYYNPPAQTGKNSSLPGSEHVDGLAVSQTPPVSDTNNGDIGGLIGQGLASNLTAEYCSSPPRFVGSNQLWVTCQDNGFMALKFTNNSYSAVPTVPSAPPASPTLPAAVVTTPAKATVTSSAVAHPSPTRRRHPPRPRHRPGHGAGAGHAPRATHPGLHRPTPRPRAAGWPPRAWRRRPHAGPPPSTRLSPAMRATAV